MWPENANFWQVVRCLLMLLAQGPRYENPCLTSSSLKDKVERPNLKQSKVALRQDSGLG